MEQIIRYTYSRRYLHYDEKHLYFENLHNYYLFQVFIKSELKVGVIYVKENQYTEEEILDNNENSPMFEEFLQVLGEKVRLKGKTNK